MIFIEGAVPGEQVRIVLKENKKNFAKAQVVERLAPAPDQVESFCPVFLRCGGCDWQHVPYEKQLRWKAGFIESALRKISGIQQTVTVVPSQKVRAYRNRIRLKADINPRGRLSLGYFAKGSHDRVVVKACPIADAPIDRAMAALIQKEWPEPWRGDLEIQVLADQSCLLQFVPPLPPLAEKALDEGISPTLAQKAREGFYRLEEDGGLQYWTQGGQFQQVNLEGNRWLRTWVKECIEAIDARTVVDLFCGSGNFSLGLKGRRVWGLEISEKAIVTANENVRVNERPDAVYRAGPANEIRSIFPDLPAKIDCVITDPPRQGMADSLRDLIALNAEHILSISCDPNTFARDLKGLMEAGYELKEIFGIDFFPHTYHVETVAHLQKRSL